jgi:transposase
VSTDARRLRPAAQEALRFRVIEAIRGGMKPARAARTFKVSRTAVYYWRRTVALGNVTSLRSKKRGRPAAPRLAGHQAATIVRLITDRTPDQLKLPFALWTREAGRDLIAQR